MVYSPKKYSKRKNQAIALPRLNLLLALIVGIIGVIYLFQINFMVSDGYKLRELSQSIEQSKKYMRQAELEVLEMQSLQKIKEEARALGLVPTSQATFVSVRKPVVALK